LYIFSEGGKHKEEKRNEMVTNQDENVRRIVEEELQKTEERLKVYLEKQMSSLEEFDFGIVPMVWYFLFLSY
jgi:hypothetical protein